MGKKGKNFNNKKYFSFTPIFNNTNNTLAWMNLRIIRRNTGELVSYKKRLYVHICMLYLQKFESRVQVNFYFGSKNVTQLYNRVATLFKLYLTVAGISMAN